MSSPRTRVETIRARLDHPIIDSDGHDTEYLPLVRDELRTLAGQTAVDRFELMVKGAQLARGLDDATRRAQGLMRIPWWGLPTGNPLDRATAMFPRLGRNPFGLALHALFGSDIGHWDVPEIEEVLVEACELVEDGIVAAEDFRRFAFASPVAFWTANNPRFFEGSAVAEAAAKERGA
jgi:hypothetical protein